MPYHHYYLNLPSGRCRTGYEWYRQVLAYVDDVNFIGDDIGKIEGNIEVLFNICKEVVQRIDSPPRGAPWATFILNDKVVYQTKQQ